MRLKDIETPALVLDLDTLRKNSSAMTHLLSGTGLALRPHYKSHKCAALAKWQILEGAKGMTCAKLSEAADLADSGIEDILIANQIVDQRKIRRLAELARVCRLSVCVDNEENLLAIAAAAKAAGSVVHLLVEYEIGMQRCGVRTKEGVLKLARLAIATDGVEFEGIQAYAGHLSHEVNVDERVSKTEENHARIRELISYLSSHGVACNTVSGGSTGTAEIKRTGGVYTELQAGSYLFMDATYGMLDLLFAPSLFLLTTVVSRSDSITVVDAGVKTCGVDQGNPVPLHGSCELIVASEEHFQLHGYTEEARVGEQIMLIPAHCCSTVNLHDKIYVVKDDKVVDRLLITARTVGK